MSACDGCLRRAWLLARLGGHLEPVRHRVLALLELGDDALIAAVGGGRTAELVAEHGGFDPAPLRARLAGRDIEVVCRHEAIYPGALRELAAPPAALFLRGEVPLWTTTGVALVGARRATSYGSELARTLAGRLATAGVPILSGLALGIDAAAHAGALRAGGATIAVLPAGPERAYPAHHRRLHRRIVESGLTVSELPPGSEVWRWAFPARNRLIAALAAATVVVEAGARSGALLTARLAAELGRAVGAVPGRPGQAGAAGPHHLIRHGATLVTSAEQILELIHLPARPPVLHRPALAGDLAAVLRQVASGRDTPAALEAAGVGPEQGLAALAALELAGYLLREPGGRYALAP